jgi:hypothetical protein
MLGLSRALETARPFENEIRAVQAFGGNDPDVMAFVAALEPYAASGVGTFAEIRAAMPALVAEVRSAIEANERSWTKRTANSLRAILTFWRPVDIPDDEAARVALATAESQLAEGRLEAAIAALDALKGPPRQAAAGLIGEMRHRLAVNRTANALSQAALGRLAGRD